MSDMSGDDNLTISPEDLSKIRQLEDFDLIMLLSEINNHGWKRWGEQLLRMILSQVESGSVNLIEGNH